jgi:hypothetical protein
MFNLIYKISDWYCLKGRAILLDIAYYIIIALMFITPVGCVIASIVCFTKKIIAAGIILLLSAIASFFIFMLIAGLVKGESDFSNSCISSNYKTTKNSSSIDKLIFICKIYNQAHEGNAIQTFSSNESITLYSNGLEISYGLKDYKVFIPFENIKSISHDNKKTINQSINQIVISLKNGFVFTVCKTNTSNKEKTSNLMLFVDKVQEAFKGATEKE